MSEREEKGLFVKWARVEKEIAEKEGRKPEGWIWTQDMDGPRNIDFEAIPEEEENPHERD